MEQLTINQQKYIELFYVQSMETETKRVQGFVSAL